MNILGSNSRVLRLPFIDSQPGSGFDLTVRLMDRYSWAYKKDNYSCTSCSLFFLGGVEGGGGWGVGSMQHPNI